MPPPTLIYSNGLLTLTNAHIFNFQINIKDEIKINKNKNKILPYYSLLHFTKYVGIDAMARVPLLGVDRGVYSQHLM